VVPTAPPPSASKAAGKRKAEPGMAEPKAPKAPKTPAPPSELTSLKSSKAALSKADVLDLSALKTADLKKKLNARVKTLARMVNDDWHDSYEFTAEEAEKWFEECGEIVEKVLRVGVAVGVAFDLCHEALNHIADTWSNINAIPFRGDVSEDISYITTPISIELGGEESADYKLRSPEALLELAWPCLLARVAADTSVTDGALLRMLKDAVDHGVARPHLPSSEETELAQSVNGDEEVFRCGEIVAGRVRLSALFTGRKLEWSALASTKKKHNMRRAIDRRYDGPKHLRTRNFGDSDDSDGYGGSFW
jgi:hypothetical protein